MLHIYYLSYGIYEQTQKGAMFQIYTKLAWHREIGIKHKILLILKI